MSYNELNFREVDQSSLPVNLDVTCLEMVALYDEKLPSVPHRLIKRMLNKQHLEPSSDIRWIPSENEYYIYPKQIL